MYEQIFRERDRDLRAADADREAMAERLRRSHAEGRLDVDEFQERLDQCYKARTIGELAQLAADLPSPERAPEQRTSLRRAPLVPLIPILITLLLISAVGHHHGFGAWILIPLFLLARYWRRRSWWWGGLRRRHGGERAV